MVSTEEIARLLAPFGVVSAGGLGQFQAYLELILKWNAKFNLTAVREPEQIVTRHFGEGVLAAGHVPNGARTLMDLGSGVGIPGVPIAITRPEVAVTLVEAHGKKAAFLREVVRSLGLNATVRAERAESVAEQFDVVALRAVERMGEVLPVALKRVREGGRILVLSGPATEFGEAGGVVWEELAVPGATRSVLRVGTVPRGTSAEAGSTSRL
jgi:16S rRNA (guanine527-N7)-methyltransferase